MGMKEKRAQERFLHHRLGGARRKLHKLRDEVHDKRRIWHRQSNRFILKIMRLRKELREGRANKRRNMSKLKVVLRELKKRGVFNKRLKEKLALYRFRMKENGRKLKMLKGKIGKTNRELRNEV